MSAAPSLPISPRIACRGRTVRLRQNLFRRLLAAAAFCLGSAVSAVAQGASVQVTQITTSDGGPFDNLPGQVFQHDLGSPITFSAVVAGFPATAADMSPANVISVIEDGVVVRLLSSDGGFPNDSHADVDYSPVSPGPKTYVVSATNGTTTVTSVPIRVNVYGISISAPVDGGAAPVSSDLFISGPTLVRNGVVGTVQFYANGIRIGADSNAPYAVAWHPTVAGAYALTARVTASDGSTSDSPPVSFTVVPAAANGTIVVNITNPAAGATVAAGTSVTVAADARVTGSAGSISQVQFYLDGMPLDTPKTAFPFTTTWSPAVAGTYSLTAIATDDKGNARAAPGVAVTVTGNFPAVELTSPANGGHVTSGSSVTLAATASGEDGSAASVRSVDFLVDGNLIGTTTVPPYAFAWAPTQPRAAPYSLVARATATNGSVVSSSPVSVTVTAGGGIAPPTVALSPGSLFSMPGGAYRLISVSATANAGRTVRTVELLVDGAVVAEDGSAPYNFLFRAPLSFGSHVLTARVTDSASIESENSVGLEITVPYGQAPTVTLQLPADGAQVDIGTDVNLSAVASDSDGTIQSVVFLANNDPVLVATAVPYAGQFFPQTAGTVTIAALATDNAGLTSLATKTITVGGQPQGTPAVTLTKPDADNAVVASGQRIVFEAVASAGSSDAFVSRVEFLVNGLPLGTDGSQVGFTNTYRVTDVFLVQPGTYTITARVTDSRGVSAESTNRQSITVKTPLGAAPTVSIVSPQAPSTGDLAFTNLSTIPLVAVAADADGAVTDVEFFVDRGQRAKATATLDTEKDKDGNVTRRFVSGVTVTQAGEGYLLIPKVAIDGDGAGASAVVATMTADKGVGDVTVVAGGSGYTAAAVRFIGGGLFEGQSIGHAVRDPGGLGWRLTMQPGQLGAGPYRLYAVARDTGGNQTISSTVRFVVTGATSLPPTVALTSNVTSTTSGQPVNLLASAFDPDGSIAAVEFFVNSTSLNKLTSGPFAQSWTPTSPGTYLVTAIATDDTGNATVSNTLTISVTGSPPTGLAPVVTILNPPGTLVVSRLSTYVFSAVAFDSDGEIASVEFYRDGVSIGTAVREEASGSYRFVYSFGGLALRPPPTPVSSGNPYKFLAVARDTTGNATTSVPVDVYVDTATSQQPVVSVGASVATVNFGQTVTLSANAVDPDGRITSIKFFANGAAVVPEITADASGSVSATTANWIPTSDGVYDVIALVRDNTGNYAVSAPTVVTVRTSTTLVDDPTFVAQTYQDLLDRTPTTPEAAAAAQITAGTLSRAQFVANIVGGPNFGSAFQSVLVYHVVVGDWPDPSDYEGGIEQLRIDSSLPDYVGLLFESDAYLALHGPAPDLATANPQQYSRVSAFATDLYKNNLGRAPTLVEVQAFFNGVSTAGVNATVANFITANFITGSNPTMTAAVRAAALYVALTQSQPTADDVVALAAEPLATAAAAVLADSLYVNRFLSISRQPDDLALAAGGDGVLSVEAMGPEPFAYQWYFNGTPLAGATNAALELHNVGAGDSGVYYAVVTNATSRVASRSATVAVAPAVTLASGAGVVIATNVVHPNGNHFDQVLATGPVETIFAAAGRITRTSFIDLNDDIVQVEFSGAGSLTLVLDAASGPAAPVNYNQPDVYYMRGHAGIVITGADETTNVTIFAVGRATAFDPTGRYDILQPPSSANDPANNGSPLFQGHAATRYDSFADLAFVAISTTDGKFGGLRTANTHYFGSSGLTGVYAPGVSFQGPLFIGDIDAFDTATPVIEVGSVADARITGGSMAQENHLPVQVSGLSRLTFTAGQNASGDVMPAQDNAAVLLQDGQDVTTRIVVKQ